MQPECMWKMKDTETESSSRQLKPVIPALNLFLGQTVWTAISGKTQMEQLSESCWFIFKWDADIVTLLIIVISCYNKLFPISVCYSWKNK